MKKNEKLITDYKLFNQLVDEAKRCTIILNKKWEEREKNESCGFYSFFHETTKYAVLTTKFYNGKMGAVISFRFDKFEDNEVSEIKGSTVYGTMQSYYKAPDFTKDEYVCKQLSYSPAENKFLVSVAGVMGYEHKYTGTRQPAWCYDRISAYAYHLTQDLPIGDTYEIEREVKEGEIGFFIVGESVELAYPGQYANFIFKLMPSPYKAYVEKYFNLKQNSTGEEKQRAKDMLNFGIGYFQRKNPFIRYYIVLKANEMIKKLIDEDTLMWNTDAIYSRKPRPDLDIGTGIGQFKLEYQGDLAYKGFIYQKGYEPPHARGFVRKIFKPGFDLLKDPMPKLAGQGLYRVVGNKLLKVNRDGI